MPIKFEGWNTFSNDIDRQQISSLISRKSFLSSIILVVKTKLSRRRLASHQNYFKDADLFEAFLIKDIIHKSNYNR